MAEQKKKLIAGWTYDTKKKMHTFYLVGQDFVWIIGMKRNKYVLVRTWLVKKAGAANTDYIGTFDKLTVAKRVADLIRTG